MNSAPTPPKVVAIVQARLGSRRLPGKVLADLCGRPVLAWVVDRCRRAGRVDELVVATTSDSQDDAVDALCRARGYRVSRGHATDVLARYVQAARETSAEVIVRVTGDCPFLDPGLVDVAVSAFLDAHPPVSLVVNRLPWDRTYPIGLDVEVFSASALQTAHERADRPHQREHVVPYLYENPETFPFLHLRHPRDYGSLRWTIDEEADLRFARAVCSRFAGRDDFAWQDILHLVESEPELAALNRSVRHKQHGEAESESLEAPGV